MCCAAPEVLGGLDNDWSSDVWGCGVALYIMVFCRHPFDEQGDR